MGVKVSTRRGLDLLAFTAQLGGMFGGGCTDVANPGGVWLYRAFENGRHMLDDGLQLDGRSLDLGCVLGFKGRRI